MANTVDAIREIEWDGPFSWPGYESYNGYSEMPDIAGVYIWTFSYADGYLLYCAGESKSTKKRFRQHALNYITGSYTIFDMEEAEQGKRVEIWHGWGYARTHQAEFIGRKEEIRAAAWRQLVSFKVFVAAVAVKRERMRLEAAIMHGIYGSSEPWAKMADRGMALSKRWVNELTLVIRNKVDVKIYGLPEVMEI